MNRNEIKNLFDQQAAGYDSQWERMAPIRIGLHFLLESVFAELPTDARILCVGAGTGAELLHLAKKFPGWRFTAVEPSGAMLDVCRRRAEEAGISSRCTFYEGYLDSLPAGDGHHGATSFLVSHFILEQDARTAFFREIADRLLEGGILVSSDLASEIGSYEYESLLRAWLDMLAVDAPPEALDRLQKDYKKNVAILPMEKVVSIIESGGFEPPVQFYQAGLIHAWFSKRRS